MPMLIPNPTSLPKSIENITKNGVDIDEVVRNSFSCAVKNSLSRFSKNTVDCITKCHHSKPLEKNSKLCNIQNLRNKNLHVLFQSNFKKQGKSKPRLDENGNVIVKKNSDCTPNTLDDSLTNLQWLTDVKVNDLLDGKPITYAPLSPAPSDASDEGESCTRRHYSDSSVDYRTNKHVKPPYSYAALIIMAMKSKSCAKMTLSEIYKWITDNFSFYKNADPSWQNSIRHNLSLNKCFAKIPRNKGDPGKGGYWRIVSEFANKLLESSIRKRRSSMIDYNCQDIIKRQRLDLFENQLLCKIKPDIKTEDRSMENNYSRTSSPAVYDTSPIQADLDQCRIDHPYGKNPYVIYDTSDEENIKAIASNLQHSSSSFGARSSQCSDDLSNSQILNTFSSVIVTDCIWSSQHPQYDNLTESMTKVTEELLEARNQSTSDSTLLSKTLGGSLNSSGGLLSSPFCLSPPLSGDDGGLSDDLEDFDETSEPFSDGINLTVHGTSMRLFEPTPEMIAKVIKEEPLSPQSIDMEE